MYKFIVRAIGAAFKWLVEIPSMDCMYEFIVRTIGAAFKWLIELPRLLVDKFNEWLAPRCPRCGSHDVWVLNVDVASNRVDYECKWCKQQWFDE